MTYNSHILDLIQVKMQGIYAVGLEPGFLFLGTMEYEELNEYAQSILKHCSEGEAGIGHVMLFNGMTIVRVMEPHFLMVGPACCNYCGDVLSRENTGKYKKYCDVCEVLAE